MVWDKWSQLILIAWLISREFSERFLCATPRSCNTKQAWEGHSHRQSTSQRRVTTHADQWIMCFTQWDTDESGLRRSVEESQHRLEAEGTGEHGRFLRETSEEAVKQKPRPQRARRPGVRKALFKGEQEERDVPLRLESMSRWAMQRHTFQGWFLCSCSVLVLSSRGLCWYFWAKRHFLYGREQAWPLCSVRGNRRLFIFLAFIPFCWPCNGFAYKRCILFNQILKLEALYIKINNNNSVPGTK